MPIRDCHVCFSVHDLMNTFSLTVVLHNYTKLVLEVA